MAKLDLTGYTNISGQVFAQAHASIAIFKKGMATPINLYEPLFAIDMFPVALFGKFESKPTDKTMWVNSKVCKEVVIVGYSLHNMTKTITLKFVPERISIKNITEEDYNNMLKRKEAYEELAKVVKKANVKFDFDIPKADDGGILDEEEKSASKQIKLGNAEYGGLTSDMIRGYWKKFFNNQDIHVSLWKQNIKSDTPEKYPDSVGTDKFKQRMPNSTGWMNGFLHTYDNIRIYYTMCKMMNLINEIASAKDSESDFFEIAKGKCSVCDGKGKDKDDKECKECEGKGTLWASKERAKFPSYEQKTKYRPKGFKGAFKDDKSAIWDMVREQVDAGMYKMEDKYPFLEVVPQVNASDDKNVSEILEAKTRRTKSDEEKEFDKIFKNFVVVAETAFPIKLEASDVSIWQLLSSWFWRGLRPHGFDWGAEYECKKCHYIYDDEKIGTCPTCKKVVQVDAVDDSSDTYTLSCGHDCDDKAFFTLEFFDLPEAFKCPGRVKPDGTKVKCSGNATKKDFQRYYWPFGMQSPAQGIGYKFYDALKNQEWKNKALDDITKDTPPNDPKDGGQMFLFPRDAWLWAAKLSTGQKKYLGFDSKENEKVETELFLVAKHMVEQYDNLRDTVQN